MRRVAAIGPGNAPSVEAPEMDGPSAREMLAILRALHGLDQVEVDVIECDPIYDVACALAVVQAQRVCR